MAISSHLVINITRRPLSVPASMKLGILNLLGLSLLKCYSTPCRKSPNCRTTANHVSNSGTSIKCYNLKVELENAAQGKVIGRTQITNTMAWVVEAFTQLVIWDTDYDSPYLINSQL